MSAHDHATRVPGCVRCQISADEAAERKTFGECVSCQRTAMPCAVCSKAADLHEHVYDEWYCQLCWDAFGDGPDSQDAVCLRVERP